MPLVANAEILNVVILYDRLAHLGRAVATYVHLRQELAGNFVAGFRLWRLERALAPAFAAEAERDLASAAVIILAVKGHRPCPPAFQRWRGGTGHDGGRPPQAVITLMEGTNNSLPTAGSWTEVLRSGATQIHDEVFVCDRPANDAGGRIPADAGTRLAMQPAEGFQPSSESSPGPIPQPQTAAPPHE